MRASQMPVIGLAVVALALPACDTHEEKPESGEHQKVVVTTPKAKDVTITERYVCQIHSQRHIEVCALMGGYLWNIHVKEGQRVKKGEPMFTILPTLYKARWEAESAEAELAKQELMNTERLAQKGVVSWREVALYKAKWARANAKAELA